MTSSQIILLILVLLIIFYFVKKFAKSASLKHYTAAELKTKMKNNRTVLLLDVRTDKERDSNHIKGSIHIPLHNLRSRISELNRYKDKEIVCYCRSGNRSLSAASILKKSGFNSANMKGGIISW